MEKSIEEKRAAVLAECERICPKGTKEQIRIGHIILEWIDWGPILAGGLRLYGVADWMYIEDEMSDDVVNHAYVLLGLETRDAVAAKDAEIAMLVEALETIAIAGVTFVLNPKDYTRKAEQLSEICQSKTMAARKALEAYRKGAPQP